MSSVKKNIQVKVSPNKTTDKNLQPALPEAIYRSEYTDRRDEVANISNNGASAAIRNDKTVEISANDMTHILMNKNNSIQMKGFKIEFLSNRLDVTTDEVTVNHHILNNKLYDLTDYKEVTTDTGEKGTVGNFCIRGTALVKGWEPDLQRYVLIRRPVRMPMFSPAVAPIKIAPGMGIVDITEATCDIASYLERNNINPTLNKNVPKDIKK